MSLPPRISPLVPRIVVCIPTYRRVSQLATLLRAVGEQRDVEPFAIVVGNNDVVDIADAVELRDPSLPDRTVVTITTRGVSAVRNAMIAHALEKYPHVEWIACIDDDQLPASDWLARLQAAGVRHGADLVGGPVRRLAAFDTPWSRGAADTSYLPTAEGETAVLNEAGNLLLSVRFLRSIERPPFLLDFGRTGGEDYEFFLFSRARGARMAWAPAATVSEVLPAGHLSLGGFMWRFYSIAAYQARADRRYRGAWAVFGSLLWRFCKSPAIVLRSALRDRDPRLVLGCVLRSLAMTAGSLAGLFGVRADRYGERTGISAPKR